jgi:hypothetical protein
MTRSTLCAKRSVSISPGLMALTRTLCEIPIYVIDLVKFGKCDIDRSAYGEFGRSGPGPDADYIHDAALNERKCGLAARVILM